MNSNDLRTVQKVIDNHLATPCPSSFWLNADYLGATCEFLNTDLQNEDHVVWAEISPREKDLTGLGNFIVSLTNAMAVGKHLSLALGNFW